MFYIWSVLLSEFLHIFFLGATVPWNRNEANPRLDIVSWKYHLALGRACRSRWVHVIENVFIYLTLPYTIHYSTRAIYCLTFCQRWSQAPRTSIKPNTWRISCGRDLTRLIFSLQSGSPSSILSGSPSISPR